MNVQGISYTKQFVYKRQGKREGKRKRDKKRR